jgi:hypothetical protein
MASLTARMIFQAAGQTIYRPVRMSGILPRWFFIYVLLEYFKATFLF